MASFTASQYGKIASFQNNSGSADAAVPEGGVYLFASGAANSAKLYLQNEGSSALIDLDSLLDIAGDSGTGTVSNSQSLTLAGGTGLDTTASGQTITFSMDLNELGAAAVDVAADSLAIVDATDNSTKKESIADLMTAAAGNGLAAASGVLAVGVDDSSIELNADALRVKAAGITNAMLADDAVDSDELAAGAVDLAHMSVNSVDSTQIVAGAIDFAHMSVNSIDSDQYVNGSIDTAHIADDQITNALMADDAIDSAQIADGAVDTAHLADDQVTLAKMAGLARGKFIYGDASGDPAALAAGADGKVLVADANGDPSWTTVSGDATLSAGALTISAGAVEHGMLAEDIISGQAALGSAAMAQADLLMFDDGPGAVKKVTFSNFEDSIFGNLSGDATVAAGGALTIAANAIQTGMVHDDVATELAGNGLAASSGVLAVQLSGAMTIASDRVGISGSFAGAGLSYSGSVNGIGGIALDIDELDALGGTGVAQGDHFLFSDAGTEKKITFSNLEDAIFGNVSGDVAVAAGGALTIQDDAVEGSMLNDNVISGQTELAHADIADADELMVSDGGTLKKVGLDSLQNHYFAAVSGDAAIADGGALTIAANAVQTGMVHDDVATELAGDGLVAASGVLAVNVADMATSMTGDLADTDEFAISDAGTMKKVDFSVVRDAVFADLSGDATVAAGGALTIASQAVENSMLADDAVGADELAADAVVNASVAAGAAIVATKLNFNVDFGGNVTFGTQSDDTVVFSGPIKAGANTIADSGNNAAISFDGSAGFGTLGGFGGGSGISFSAAAGAQFATDLTLNKSDGTMSKDAKFFGDTAGAYFMWDGGEDRVKVHNGTAQVLEMGNTAGGYAIDVAQGSNANINKIRAAAFVTYSDESLKCEVQTMNNALDTVMSLNGVEFTWNDSGERDFGFIAQDVQNVLPKAVHVAADGVQGVDYSRLTSVLVEAVKAQQIQINDLKKALKK